MSDNLNDIDVTALDDATWRRLLWRKVQDINDQTQKTNGRVTRLERWMWMCIGGMAVVSAIVTPLFLNTVSK